jgi:ribose 5-phosphate isomerase B
MRLAIGNDHRGFKLKQELISFIAERGDEYQDFGSYDTAPVDYPDFAQKVAEAVVKGEAKMGILICGSGLGMSIAANKICGIRATLCQDIFTARLARQHNNANILCLGGEVVGPGLAKEIVQIFLTTDFEGGRHATRLEKVAKLESKQCQKS